MDLDLLSIPIRNQTTSNSPASSTSTLLNKHTSRFSPPPSRQHPAVLATMSSPTILTEPTPSMNAAESGTVPDYYSSGLRARFCLDAAKAPVTLHKESYADIGYDFDEAAFRRRSATRLAAGDLATSVPAGWPTELEGPLAWTTADFNNADESVYVYSLTGEDKEEISKALEAFKGGMRKPSPGIRHRDVSFANTAFVRVTNRKGTRRQRSVACQLPSSQHEREA